MTDEHGFVEQVGFVDRVTDALRGESFTWLRTSLGRLAPRRGLAPAGNITRSESYKLVTRVASFVVAPETPSLLFIGDLSSRAGGGEL